MKINHIIVHSIEKEQHQGQADVEQPMIRINGDLRSLLIAGLILLLTACGGSSGGTNESNGETRPFRMGFTPWPYDDSVDAVNFIYSQIFTHGDIVAHHLDAGIPWQEALDGLPYPAEVEAEINDRVQRTPASVPVYLAISPFNSERNNLAGYWGPGTQQPLPGDWATYDFDSPQVIQAYTNFAVDMINRFDPDYFNLGIEASELAINDLSKYQRFLTFLEQVCSSLRLNFPELELMISVALKAPGSNAADTINAYLPQAVQYIDVVGVSVYPYIFFDHEDKGDPANLPENWLSQIQTVAGNKPVAIAETGWAAELVNIPAFGVNVPVDSADQNHYVKELFKEATALRVSFIIWFSLVDFDLLWNDALGQDPLARIWRDTGLYDENLNARSAQQTWINQLNKKFMANN